MRSILIFILVLTAAGIIVAGFALAQQSQEKTDTDKTTERLKAAIEELRKQTTLTDDDKSQIELMQKCIDRLTDIESRLEELESEAWILRRQGNTLMKRLAEKEIAKGRYREAADILYGILATDPENPDVNAILEQILPQVCASAYSNRWVAKSSVDRWQEGPLDKPSDRQFSQASYALAPLRWLHFHCDHDGRWDQDGFDKNCDTRKSAACDGKGTSQYDVGVTGLALLAFMGTGNTHRAGPWRKTVDKGLNWLLSEQQEDGSIGRTKAESWIYNHAIATQALCEAYAMTRDPKLKEPCEKAIAFTLKAQNEGLGWKYEPKGERGGSSITAWMLLALGAARNAGFTLDKSVFEGALKWFDSVTDGTGHVGCRRRGHDGCDIRDRSDFFEKLPSMTAAAVFCRLLCGQDKDDPVIRKGVAILMDNLPDWNKPKNDKVDMYYWFFGTYAMFQYGGEEWEKWDKAMREALLDTQRVGECADGSWDPVGKWGMVGGRVYATAINCLTIEVYYRYTRVGSEETESPESENSGDDK